MTMLGVISDAEFDNSLPFVRPGIGVAGFNNLWTAMQLTAHDGDDVATIPNLVDGGAPLVVPAGGSAPVFHDDDQPWISFDGISDRLQAAIVQPGPFTLFIGLKMNSPLGAARYLAESGGTLFRMTSTGLLNDSAGNVSGPPVNRAGFSIYTLVRDSPASVLGVDDTEAANTFAANTANLNNLMFGGAATPTACDWAFGITFPYVLDYAARQTARANLRSIYLP